MLLADYDDINKLGLQSTSCRCIVDQKISYGGTYYHTFVVLADLVTIVFNIIPLHLCFEPSILSEYSNPTCMLRCIYRHVRYHGTSYQRVRTVLVAVISHICMIIALLIQNFGQVLVHSQLNDYQALISRSMPIYVCMISETTLNILPDPIS